jgi:hypothetical protein
MISSLSPTACAEQILDELLILGGGQRERMLLLLRQLVRDQYEHCARIAEHWVPNNDLYEARTGIEVGDAIAEEIRRLADERVRIVGRA